MLKLLSTVGLAATIVFAPMAAMARVSEQSGSMSAPAESSSDAPANTAKAAKKKPAKPTKKALKPAPKAKTPVKKATPAM
jgi:hypothetical protein